jgi:heat shock protein HslJ
LVSEKGVFQGTYQCQPLNLTANQQARPQPPFEDGQSGRCISLLGIDQLPGIDFQASSVMKKWIPLVFVVIACHPAEQVSDIVGVPERPPLKGSHWRLTSLNGREVSSGTFQFLSSKNELIGSLGCNRIGGSFEAGKSKLHLEPVVEQPFCQENAEVKTEVLQTLGSVSCYRIDERVLYLMSRKKVVATLSPYAPN